MKSRCSIARNSSCVLGMSRGNKPVKPSIDQEQLVATYEAPESLG